MTIVTGEGVYGMDDAKLNGRELTVQSYLEDAKRDGRWLQN